MAGPWFTVQKSKSGWKQVDSIWLSNAGKNAKARVEIKVELEGSAREVATASQRDGKNLLSSDVE